MLRKYYMVSLYRNSTGEIITIPHKRKDNFSVEALPYQILERYDNYTLGNVVKGMFQRIKDHQVEEANQGEKVFQLASKIKTFKSFSKKHLLVQIFLFEDNNQYTISHWPRLKDGSYGLEKHMMQGDIVEYTLSEDVSEMEFGDIILKAFSDGETYMKSKGNY